MGECTPAAIHRPGNGQYFPRYGAQGRAMPKQSLEKQSNNQLKQMTALDNDLRDSERSSPITKNVNQNLKLIPANFKRQKLPIYLIRLQVVKSLTAARNPDVFLCINHVM